MSAQQSAQSEISREQKSLFKDKVRLFLIANKLEVIITGILFFLFLLLVSAYTYFYLQSNNRGQLAILAPVASFSSNLASSSAVLGEEVEEVKETGDVEPVQEEQAEVTQEQSPPPAAPKQAYSATFPNWGTPNNKFGMYINAEIDEIAEIAPLVNSNGGDWGWALIPFPINDYNHDHWHDIFSRCADKHIKPVVQLFNNHTCNPDEMNFAGIAEFLNELPWPTKHLYISVFNELNAVYYWCERIAPEEYAVALNKAIDAFKAENENFFIMPGAFNSSARTGPRYLDEEDYLLRMNQAVPGIFAKLDGWATHAYPHPEFSGDFYNSPSHYGVRDQIENYKWELGLLQRHFGVTGLPVFITETGWAHREGSSNPKPQYKSSTVTARYFDDAYRNHWLPDNRIVAVMPFVWSKSDHVSKHFNWKKDDGSYYPQYEVIRSFPKVAGTND